tara:strand:- start:3640 stop:4446 length:807 start_codon:yes stop_codon:yes gene_type:complete
MNNIIYYKSFLAILEREIIKLFNQKGRLLSSIVRPSLWLFIFAAGFGNIFGVSIIPPYETYITYQVYVLPGLIGIILLYNGMQSSLSIVYDREMGMMRLLLVSPIPRWYMLFSKIIASTILSIIQVYVFLLLCFVFDISLPFIGLLYIFPFLVISGFMLGSLALLITVYIKQLENFAGIMNFVIFPMFFLSTSLYPAWKIRESGNEILYWLLQLNPFTHNVELIRHSAYSSFNLNSFLIVLLSGLFFFYTSAYGYSPKFGYAKKLTNP